MFDLIDVKLIKYADEELTLSSVAARARLSLPAVSLRITRLEEKLGVKLLHRTGQLRLTDAGKRFLISANLMIAEAEKLTADIDEIKLGKSARIKIMCNTSVAMDDLPLAIDRLDVEFPTVHFEITDGSFPEIRRAVFENHVDVGLIISPTQIPGVDLIPYKQEKFVLLVPADHELAQLSTRQIKFKDALKYAFIGVERTKYTRSLADSIALEYSTHIHYRAIVDDFETQCTIVGKTHLGIALVLESVAKRHILISNTRIIQLNDEWANSEFMICVRQSENVSPVVKRFIELMQKRFAQI